MNSFGACDEMRGSLVCPKPRRIGQISPSASDPIRFHLWHASHQVDQVGVELLDIFFTQQEHLSHPMDSPAPFFCGSPPSRSGNPLIHDVRFGEVNPDTVVLDSPALAAPISVSATAKKGCTWTKFGFSPAAVRVEGFDSLDRDGSRSRGIPAFA